MTKNDLDLIHIMERYPHAEIANAARNCLVHSLYLLSKELVALAFFDDRQNDMQKRDNVVKLNLLSIKTLKKLDAYCFHRCALVKHCCFVIQSSKTLFQLRHGNDNAEPRVSHDKFRVQVL